MMFSLHFSYLGPADMRSSFSGHPRGMHPDILPELAKGGFSETLLRWLVNGKTISKTAALLLCRVVAPERV